MGLVSQSMKVVRGLNVWEISIFKISLVAITWLLAIWFPVLLTADMWVYISVFVVSMVLTLMILFKRQGNFYKVIFTQGFGAHIFSDICIFGISMFKITMFSFALLLAKVFPVVLMAHMGWYIGVSAIFIGYYVHEIFQTK